MPSIFVWLQTARMRVWWDAWSHLASDMLLACKDHRNPVDLIGLAFKMVAQRFSNLYLLTSFRRIIFAFFTYLNQDCALWRKSLWTSLLPSSVLRFNYLSIIITKTDFSKGLQNPWITTLIPVVNAPWTYAAAWLNFLPISVSTDMFEFQS